MLQIAVREMSALDVLHQRPELLPQRRQLPGLVQQTLDAPIEVLPLHPRHLHDGKGAAFDPQPIGQIDELGAVRRAVLLQVLGDGRVPLGVVRDWPQKTPHRPGALPQRGFVHDGIAAGRRLGHPEAVLVDLRLLQLGIAERPLRRLQRFVVLGEIGPGGHR